MLDGAADGYTTADGRKIGGVMMEMKNITLRFGGVVAIKDISFDIREGEIRAIIGPNGAGKSSMLNVISGFYVPQEGEVWFRGSLRPQMKPYEVARQGIARTFQNIALFEGMTVLDNVMTGRISPSRISNEISLIASTPPNRRVMPRISIKTPPIWRPSAVTSGSTISFIAPPQSSFVQKYLRAKRTHGMVGGAKAKLSVVPSFRSHLPRANHLRITNIQGRGNLALASVFIGHFGLCRYL